MTEHKRYFIDTNILIYTIDNDEGSREKRERAIAFLKKISKEGEVVISTQVLQEFFYKVTTKLHNDVLAVRGIVDRYIEGLEVEQVTPEVILEGIDISIVNRLGFWDGLIMAAAKSAGCDCVVSEDMNHGQVVRGVKIVNPFLEV